MERVEFADAVGFGRAAVTAGWDGFVFLYLCDENAVRGTGWRLARRFKGARARGWCRWRRPAGRRRGDTDGRGMRVDVRVVHPARTLRQDGSVTKVRFIQTPRRNDVLVASASTLGTWHQDLAAGTGSPRCGATRSGVARAPPRPQRRDPHRAHVFEGLHPPDVALRRGGPRWPADVPRGEGAAVDIASVDVAGPRRRDSLVGRLGPPSRRACPTALCATCGADGVVVVRDVCTGEVVSKLTVDRPDAPMCATFFERPEDPADFVDDSPISSVPRVSGGVRGDARDGARTHTWLATGYRTANDGGELRLWDPLGGGVAAVLSDQSRPVSDVVATAHALVAVAPGEGVVVYAGVDDDDRRDARDGTARRPAAAPSPRRSRCWTARRGWVLLVRGGVRRSARRGELGTGRCSCSTLGFRRDGETAGLARRTEESAASV